MASRDFLSVCTRHGGLSGLFLVLGLGGAHANNDVTPEVLAQMDDCLEKGVWERDVLNTSIVCFNEAHQVCTADAAGCEASLAQALTARADAQHARMPTHLSEVAESGDARMPAFAGDRYREILSDVEDGATALCVDVAKPELASCTYRAQAVRLARLRSLGSQIDPRLLVP